MATQRTSSIGIKYNLLDATNVSAFDDAGGEVSANQFLARLFGDNVTISNPENTTTISAGSYAEFLVPTELLESVSVDTLQNEVDTHAVRYLRQFAA